MSGKIIFNGTYYEKDVLSTYQKISSRKINSEVESKVEKLWNEKLKNARAEGKQIWDQPIFRLEKYNIREGICRLTFSTISYKTQSIIIQFSSILQNNGNDYMPKGTYTSFFIETSNGEFVFGEKSNQYVTNRTFSYIGGIFNQDKQNIESVNLFDSAKKELEEELGIDVNDHIDQMALIGASQNDQGIIGFIFYCKLSIPSIRVKEIFEQNNDQELKTLHYLAKSELREFCIEKIKKESTIVDLFDKYELSKKNNSLQN